MAHIARISTAMLLSGLIINSAKAGTGSGEMSSQRMGGIYLGLAGAYDTGEIKATGIATGAGVNDSFNQRIHGQGAAGGLYGGYGAWRDSFYFGIEGSSFLSGREGKTKFSSSFGGGQSLSTIKAERSHSLGIAGRAGILLGTTLLYAKLGLETARWRFSFSRMVADSAEAANKKRSKNLIGIASGLGVEMPMISSQPLALRIEYGQAFYGKQRLNFAAPDTAAYRGSVKFMPTTHVFTIGVAYKFNQQPAFKPGR